MTAKKSGNSTEAWLVSPTFKSTAKIQLDYFLKDPSAALSICKRVESQASAVLECVGKATEGDKQQWRKIHVEIPASSKAYQVRVSR